MGRSNFVACVVLILVSYVAHADSTAKLTEAERKECSSLALKARAGTVLTPEERTKYNSCLWRINQNDEEGIPGIVTKEPFNEGLMNLLNPNSTFEGSYQ